MSNLTFLGTGTSSGVPVLGCDCDVCNSKDPKDKRFRSSALFVTDKNTRILIDIGPDFRLQSLANGIRWIDGILITHPHYDHIGGLDEIRQINFIMRQKIQVYGNSLTLDEISNRFDYIFKPTQIGGGKPQIELINIIGDFHIKEQKITPIEVLHGEIPITCFRIGNLVYITDASFISNESLDIMKGAKILVINALRVEPHPTHFSLGQSLEVASKIKPDKTFLIHLTHHFKHKRDTIRLPENVYFAYDGLKIEISI